MALAFYLDHQVPRAVAHGLQLRGIDVLTAYDDRRSEAADPAILDRATELRRVLFTQDDDFLVEAAKRVCDNVPFCGVIYAHQMRVSVGACVRDLELIAKACRAEDLVNIVLFLPL